MYWFSTYTVKPRPEWAWSCLKCFCRASTWFHNNRYYNGTIYIIYNVIVLSDLVKSSGYSSKTLQKGSCPYATLDEVLRYNICTFMKPSSSTSICLWWRSPAFYLYLYLYRKFFPLVSLRIFVHQFFMQDTSVFKYLNIIQIKMIYQMFSVLQRNSYFIFYFVTIVWFLIWKCGNIHKVESWCYHYKML